MARPRAPLSAALLAAGWLASCREGGEPGATASGGGDPRPPWQQIDRPSLAACGICHVEVYDEWEESLHHRAWTNANVRAETDDFAQAACRPCHSPRAVLVSGLDRRPDYREFNQPDGVHCLSCHGLADGVAAVRTIADAPCRPRFSPDLLRAESCWPCHEPTHKAFSEYATSDARAIGLRCADCHMPPCSDRPGRSHASNGGLNADFVQRAIAWQCERVGGEIVVTLRNRTGHKFPGEIPSRVFQVKVATEEGEPLYATLRKPGKSETREDDRLGVNETRVLRFSIAASAQNVRVSLLFKPFPLLPDDEAFLLGEWSGPPR
jgi:cytochrome c554/c'-like protein